MSIQIPFQLSLERQYQHGTGLEITFDQIPVVSFLTASYVSRSAGNIVVNVRWGNPDGVPDITTYTLIHGDDNSRTVYNGAINSVQLTVDENIPWFRIFVTYENDDISAIVEVDRSEFLIEDGSTLNDTPQNVEVQELPRRPTGFNYVLTWEPPPFVLKTILGYQVRVAGGTPFPSFPDEIEDFDVNQREYRLGSNQVNNFRVRTIYTDGTTSSYVRIRRADYGDGASPPPEMVGVEYLSIDASNSYYTIFWEHANDANHTSWRVQVNSESPVSLPASATHHTFSLTNTAIQDGNNTVSVWSISRLGIASEAIEVPQADWQTTAPSAYQPVSNLRAVFSEIGQGMLEVYNVTWDLPDQRGRTSVLYRINNGASTILQPNATSATIHITAGDSNFIEVFIQYGAENSSLIRTELIRFQPPGNVAVMETGGSAVSRSYRATWAAPLAGTPRHYEHRLRFVNVEGEGLINGFTNTTNSLAGTLAISDTLRDRAPGAEFQVRASYTDGNSIWISVHKDDWTLL